VSNFEKLKQLYFIINHLTADKTIPLRLYEKWKTGIFKATLQIKLELRNETQRATNSWHTDF